MEYLLIIFLLIGSLTLWAVIGKSKLLISFLIFVFVWTIGMGYITYYDTLSRPKNVTYELMRNDESVKVAAFAIDPGVALYVLMSLDGIDEPRYYKFDWSEGVQKMAMSLLEGQENKQKMRITKPFEDSKSEDRIAHPEPQPKMPEKEPQPMNEIIEVPEQ